MPGLLRTKSIFLFFLLLRDYDFQVLLSMVEGLRRTPVGRDSTLRIEKKERKSRGARDQQRNSYIWKPQVKLGSCSQLSRLLVEKKVAVSASKVEKWRHGTSAFGSQCP